jgi:hypothetical protein
MGGEVVNRIVQLVKNQDWLSLLLVPHQELIASLSLDDLVRLASVWVTLDRSKLSLEEVSIELLVAASKAHPVEWSRSWRYDALIGGLYVLEGGDHGHRRFYWYQKAMAKAGWPTPPDLLYSMATCSSDFDAPITKEAAIDFYLKELLLQRHYREAVFSLKNKLKDVGRMEEAAHWEKVWKEIEFTGEDLPDSGPDACSRTWDDWDCLK